MDHFFTPAGVALTSVSGTNAVSGGNQALLVVSSNFDLRYDTEQGATLLSVDPWRYDDATASGGSAGRPGGALVKLGPGAQLGSFAGPVAIVDQATCPGLGQVEALVASRYTRKLYRFPIGADGGVAPCQGVACEVALDEDLLDPAAIGIACRSDGLRRSAWVGYLRAPPIGPVLGRTGWISEFDLGDLQQPPRTIPLGFGPVGDMAYDALTDRLYAIGRFAGLYAPLNIVELPACVHTASGCPVARVQTIDLYQSLAGAELVGIALSNPQPGRGRLAYISARIFDESYARATRARPSWDIGGALLVVELNDGVTGVPSARVRQVVPIGLGAGSVRVLPVRPGLADIVVVPSTGDGTLQIYDDEVGAVVRVVSLDQVTGAPEAGRHPSAMAVDDRGAEALVYVAAFTDWTVSILRVPLATPSTADLLRHPAGVPQAGKPIRIGSVQP
jgi:hypothetical protein